MYRYLLICLVPLLIVACGKTDPQLSRLSDDSLVLAFGDSLTYGTGVSQDKSYPSILSAMIDRKIINAGIPGELSEQGLQRLSGLMEKYRPQLVILCHGGNDILRHKSPQQTKNNLEKMIRMIRSYHADVVMLAVPEFGLFVSPAKYYESLGEEQHVPVEMNIIPELEKSPSEKSDSVHFNESGYKKMARAIDRLLRENGAL